LNPYALLADLVLLLHFGIVLFIICGQALILLGNNRDWRWVNKLWFRLTHLLAIGIVVLQAWLGVLCPLTVLETWLREQAGTVGYTQSFVGYWVGRVLFHQAEWWVFVVAYSLFGLLVGWSWWRYPPRRSR
jgi:hypothetical protein